MAYKLVENNLRIIRDELLSQCTTAITRERTDFMDLLKNANAMEKYMVARVYCQNPWDIGSLHVLGILQKVGILSATEYILFSSKHDAELQLKLNDFLEAEFELLADLFIKAQCDARNAIKLNAILDECLHSLYTGLLQNQALNNLDYLVTMREILPADFLLKVVQKHIEAVLELHSCSLESAFRNFSAWINEGVDVLIFTKTLCTKLLRFQEKEAFAHLLKLSTTNNFANWKFYLILLQTLACNCAAENAAYIRTYSKTRLRLLAAMPCKNSMLHLLLTVRAATATTMDIEKNISAYADWYKQYIGDMKFVLKVEEFQNVLSLLEQCVDYEKEEFYLEIHAGFTISPPVHCGKLVQNYKSKCRMRLSQVKGNASQTSQLDASILIEDSN